MIVRSIAFVSGKGGGVGIMDDLGSIYGPRRRGGGRGQGALCFGYTCFKR